eukprot:scaffold1954_cov268-Pinguiococcus_pyrenoidosus.AAC.200
MPKVYIVRDDETLARPCPGSHCRTSPIYVERAAPENIQHGKAAVPGEAGLAIVHHHVRAQVKRSHLVNAAAAKGRVAQHKDQGVLRPPIKQSFLDQAA